MFFADVQHRLQSTIVDDHKLQFAVTFGTLLDKRLQAERELTIAFHLQLDR